LLLELGLDVRSVSDAIPGSGCGEREGRDACDISEAERDDEGNEESDDRGSGAPGLVGFA